MRMLRDTSMGIMPISVGCVWMTLAIFRWGIVPMASGTMVDFVLSPATESTNQGEISLIINESNLLRDTKTTTASGNILADLGIRMDGSHPVVDTLTIQGGSVDFTDLHFRLGFNTVIIDGEGMGGTPSTPFPPASVTNGTFNAAEHEMLMDRGKFVVSGLLYNDTFDLADMPVSGPGLGMGSIGLTEVSRIGQVVTYEAKLALPIDFEQRMLNIDDNDPVNLDVAVSAAIEAIGRFQMSLSGDDADFDESGIVDGVDLLHWQRGFGIAKGAMAAHGDANGDGAVDDADYQIWTQQLSGGSGSATAVATANLVPEPCCSGAALSLLLFLATRHAGRKCNARR
ncbi:MAG: hypothetical protein R3E01_15850 [Pirellulaceae bacterium]|nr:hypothetical protein [Planctomycetales bacterium]